MTGFLNALAAERKQLLATINPREENEARLASEGAAAALAACLSGPRNHRLTGSSPEEMQLSDESIAAHQRHAGLVTTRERAEARIAEIDALLNAQSQKDQAAAELKQAKAALQQSRSRVQQLERIAAELKAEISGLEQQAAAVLKSYGAEELAARLSGKSATQPNELARIENDLRSRRAALEATESAQAAESAQAKACAQTTQEAENRVRLAQRGLAELAWYEDLPKILERQAMLEATGSPMAARIFAQDPDPQLLQAAHDALREERDAV